MPAAPKRRWFQFSLKGLLGLLTLAAALSALFGYSLSKWREQLAKRERAEKLNNLIVSCGGFWDDEGEGVSFAGEHLSKSKLDAVLRELKAYDGLTSIHVNATDFDDSHVRHIIPHSALEQINLANTLVTDAGLRELVELKDLTWIDVNNDLITDQGLEELAKLTKLQYLEVRGTKVTTQGIEKLKRRFPELKINTYLGDE